MKFLLNKKIISIILLLLLNLNFIYCVNEEIEKAILNFNKGSYDFAEKIFNKYKDYSNAALEYLVRINIIRGRYKKALNLCDELISKGRGDRGKIYKGEIFMKLGKYTAAKLIFLDVYKDNPNNIRVKTDLGLYYYTIGNRERYIRYFSEIFDEYDPYNEYTAEELTYISIACKIYAMNSDEVDRVDTLNTIVQDILYTALQKDKYYFLAYRVMIEIFVEAFNMRDANKYVKEAMELNSNNPDILYCKALYELNSLIFNLKTKALKTLKQLYYINPNMIEALNLSAKIALSDEEYEKAQSYINKALKINPNNLETLSLQAALYYMKGRKIGYENLCDKVLSINPNFGKLYYIVADIITHKRKFEEAAILNRKAIKLDPFLWHAYIDLAMNLMRIGEEKEAKKYFEKLHEEYNFHIQSYNMFVLLKKLQEFKTFRTEHFIIKVHISEADVMAPLLMELLEKGFRVLTKRYRFVPKVPILCEMFPNHQDFSVRTIGLDSIGANGACFGKVIIDVSPKSRKFGYFNWASVAWHEFTHVITLQMTDYNIPRWFTEGLSEYSEKMRNSSCQRRLDRELYSVYTQGLMRDMSTLNAGFTRPRYPLEIAVCYYQAGLICEFIHKKYGFDKIIQMLKLYKQDKRDREVFKIALGLSLKEFDNIFLQWLKENIFSKIDVFPYIKDTYLEDLKDEIEEAPNNEKIIEKLCIGFYYKKNYIDAEIYAQKLIRLNPRNKVGYGILGLIYFDKKQIDKSFKYLKKASDLGSKNFDINFILGLIYWRKYRNINLAIRYFEIAKKSFPHYVNMKNNPYLCLYQIYKELGKREKCFKILEDYLNLQGKDFKRRLELGVLYLYSKKYKKALKLLKEAQEINPYSVKLEEALGKLYKIMKNWDKSLETYKILLALVKKKEKYKVYTEIAELYLIKGDIKRAKVSIDEAINLNPFYRKARILKDKIYSYIK